VAPRQLAMHICRKVLKMPYTKIGDQFSRDHSTVMSAVKHVDKAISTPNSDLLASLNAVTKKIQQN